MADGHVTPQERARIDRMTDRESREIYQQIHDRQQSRRSSRRRPPRLGPRPQQWQLEPGARPQRLEQP
jgi:hypothetical protein